jgi:hypothetical protein
VLLVTLLLFDGRRHSASATSAIPPSSYYQTVAERKMFGELNELTSRAVSGGNSPAYHEVAGSGRR